MRAGSGKGEGQGEEVEKSLREYKKPCLFAVVLFQDGVEVAPQAASKLEKHLALFRPESSGELVGVQPLRKFSNVGDGGGHGDDADHAALFLEVTRHGEQRFKRVPTRTVTHHVALVDDERREPSEKSFFDELSKDEERLFDGGDDDVRLFDG